MKPHVQFFLLPLPLPLPLPMAFFVSFSSCVWTRSCFLSEYVRIEDIVIVTVTRVIEIEYLGLVVFVSFSCSCMHLDYLSETSASWCGSGEARFEFEWTISVDVGTPSRQRKLADVVSPWRGGRGDHIGWWCERSADGMVRYCTGGGCVLWVICDIWWGLVYYFFISNDWQWG